MADLDPGTWTEVSDFGSKGRFGIPAAARRRLPWFEKAVRVGLLATLEPGGIAQLKPWEEAGNAAIARIKEAMEIAGPDRQSEIALAAMDRFMLVNLEDNGRLVVPANLVAHLDPTRSGRARVVVRQANLWLWSEDAWQAARADRLSLLAARE